MASGAMQAATLACLVATGILVAAEYAHKRALYILAKCAASAAFLGVGGCALARSTEPAYAHLMMVGLAFGAAGDVALLGKSQRAFLVGLGAFLVGHLAYIAAFTTICAPASWWSWSALGTVVLSAMVVRWLYPHAGRLRYPVIAYIAVITAMRIGSLGAGQYLAYPKSLCCALAGIAFYASDYCVARERFVAKDFRNKLIGLPLYFGAQLLFAWSL